MIRYFLEEDAWCYWVVSVGALLSFLGLIVACICSCRRTENKNEFLGLAGMVTLNNSENEGFDRLPISDTSHPSPQDTTDCGKSRTTGANRSLPDIPKDKGKRQDGVNVSASRDIYETTETICDHSELYATVQDTAVEEHVPEQEEVLHQKSANQDSSVHQYSRFPSGTSDNEHPYAQLQNIQKAEASQLPRHNINQTVDTEKASTSTNQANGNPVAPPRTRRSSSHNSLLSTDVLSCDIQAANAISGGIQANQELPYMTPPLLMLFSQPTQQPQSNSPQQHFSGDSQDSKGYTSISVREPLANIIAQTKRICRQNESARPLTADPHYATVSDDSDEMYAAIDEQEKVYTSGSETYAQIQPMVTEVQRVIQAEQTFSRSPSRSDEVHPAPQPPSVDSLRHVAHAHSRQASSSSANSSIVNPGSPKPEKRQANSPLPPPPEGSTEVYASIEKRTKTDDRSKAAGTSNGKSLEDMYAKVMKKKKDSEEQSDSQAGPKTPLHPEIVGVPCGKSSLTDVNNRISWSSHDSADTQRREYCDSLNQTLSDDSTTSNVPVGMDASRKLSWVGKEDTDTAEATASIFAGEHGYEAVSSNNPAIRSSYDSNYEVLHPQRATDTCANSCAASVPGSLAGRNDTDLPVTYSLPFKHRQVSNASSEDPGYEKVRLKRRIDVDQDQDTDSEPNYESMPHDAGEPNYASVCRPGDSDTDPNYESVNHGDPNYESVKYMSVTRNEEPPYEQVNTYKTDSSRDGYEKVNKQLFNADYERIQLNDLPIGNGDTDDEQYVQV